MATTCGRCQYAVNQTASMEGCIMQLLCTLHPIGVLAVHSDADPSDLSDRSANCEQTNSVPFGHQPPAVPGRSTLYLSRSAQLS